VWLKQCSLPSKCKALSSNPSTAKKRKKKRRPSGLTTRWQPKKSQAYCRQMHPESRSPCCEERLRIASHVKQRQEGPLGVTKQMLPVSKRSGLECGHGEQCHHTSAVTEPRTELLEVGPLVSVKLCGPEGCFLNKSSGTNVIANRPKEQRQECRGCSQWAHPQGTPCKLEKTPSQKKMSCKGIQ
jgi:hypothetical protein